MEEYFQVNAFEDIVSRDAWPSFPSRVALNVDRMLDVLARFGVRGTFFTLGWVAKRHPRVVTRIAAAGHEIASHGWWHRKVTSLTVSEFREEVRSTKALLEDITGQPVQGYRAPSFSIVPGREWAFDVLIEEGHTYDSSIFPIRRTDYGYPDATPIAHVIERPSGRICEFPLATRLLNGVRIPAAGGGYFRIYPYNIIRSAFREHTEQGLPGVFYIHPWELDPEQPRLPVSLLTKMRHYSGLRASGEKLERLLGEFRFTSLAEGMESLRLPTDPLVGAAPRP